MRRFFIVFLTLLVLLVTLPACTAKPTSDVNTVPAGTLAVDKVFTYSQKLSDAALAYYLGKDYDSTYDSVLFGITAGVRHTSPVYNMVVNSYKYYDSGVYIATYVTDPNAGVKDTVEMSISFTYYNVTGEYQSEIDRYLAGVRNIVITNKGR